MTANRRDSEAISNELDRTGSPPRALDADAVGRVEAVNSVERVHHDLMHATRLLLLGELATSIAHEVRQPLTAIIASCEAGMHWLERPTPDLGEVSAILVQTAQDARRACDIITRIKALASHAVPVRGPVAINELARSTSSFIRHEAETAGVAITIELAPGLPDLVADRTQLQQVVINLTINALQALGTVPCPRRLVIRTRRASNAVRFEVEDNGPGIGEEDCGRIFDSFFTTKPDGLGVGLSLSRSIVESHGGRMWVESTRGLGAKFCFELPTP